MEDGAPVSGSRRGYLAAAAGAVVGALLGFGFATVLAAQVEAHNDPVPSPIFLIRLGVAVGSAVGCYVVLRIGGHRAPLPTAVFVPALLVFFMIVYVGGLGYVLVETHTHLLTYAAIPLAALIARGLAIRIPG